jgi:hypothetical protein
MHAGGRPTKRTPEITEKICEALSYGLSHEEVAALVGINDATLYEWKKIESFAEEIKSAIAANLVRLKKIEDGAPGWQGVAWCMERQYPSRYARPARRSNARRAATPSMPNAMTPDTALTLADKPGTETELGRKSFVHPLCEDFSNKAA